MGLFGRAMCEGSRCKQTPPPAVSPQRHIASRSGELRFFSCRAVVRHCPLSHQPPPIGFRRSVRLLLSNCGGDVSGLLSRAFAYQMSPTQTSAQTVQLYFCLFWQSCSSPSPDQLCTILRARAALFSYCLYAGRGSTARWVCERAMGVCNGAAVVI